VVFGLWAAALFVGIAALTGSLTAAMRAHRAAQLHRTEVRAGRDGRRGDAGRSSSSAETLILNPRRASLPARQKRLASTWLRCERRSVARLAHHRTCGDDAAWRSCLKRRYFDQGHLGAPAPTPRSACLFVNVSIGGTLTHFAARRRCLMVAQTWQWDTRVHARAPSAGARALSAVTSTLATTLVLRRELTAIPVLSRAAPCPVPAWLTLLHLAFLGAVVAFAHHPDVFFGVFMLFLGLVTATNEYQDNLKLKEALLVGFFLAGLVTIGSLQGLLAQAVDRPPRRRDALLRHYGRSRPMTDNAALTYLGSLVEGISAGFEVCARRRRGDRRRADRDRQRAEPGGRRHSANRESLRRRTASARSACCSERSSRPRSRSCSSG
jgi:hypothetical protein